MHVLLNRAAAAAMSTCMLAGLMALALPARAADVTLTVRTDQVANTIDPHIYGHFFEHIYHSANGGLWGEEVWNRSFEQRSNGPLGWYHDNDEVTYDGKPGDARLTGGFEWTDCDFTVQEKRSQGDGPLRVYVRTKGTDMIVLSLGAENNTRHTLAHVVGRRGQRAPKPVDISNPVDGSIHSDQWYTVRVRCEGPHVQAWLDGKPLFDGQMPADTLAQGFVGVGAFQCNATFRNFRVTGLDGQVYWDRLLPAPQKNSIAEKWSVTSGEGRIIKEGALNDESYLSLRPARDSADAAVQQEDFTLHAGDTLNGSLWLTGTADGGVVQFVKDNHVLAEEKLPQILGAWKEYPLHLTASQDVQGATLRLAFHGVTEVGVDQVSLMAESSRKNGGFRPDLYNAFAGLKPTVIRWPGGCYAEQYKWKNGIGPQTQRKKSLTPWWEDYDPNALGTDEYIELCRKIKADPLLVINTGMHVTGTSNAEQWQPWIEEACQWVEYCNGTAASEWGKVRVANGHPDPYHVKFWEIDNELWRSKQTSPAVYAEAVKLFSAAMKKVDPTITIIAHGGNALDEKYDKVLVDNAAESFDVLSIHHYTDPQDFDTGVGQQDKLYTDVIKLLRGSKNPSAKLYVSEWNAQTTDWRTGLYAGGLLNVFERHGDTLLMGGPALLAREVTAHDWDNAFINFDRNGWFAGPNYVVMKLWRDNFAPQRLELTGDQKALNIVATRAENGDLVLKAVNPGNRPLSVAAAVQGAVHPATANMQIVAPGRVDARNSMEAPDVVHVQPASASVDGDTVNFSMPAYSAAVVRVQAH